MESVELRGQSQVSVCENLGVIWEELNAQQVSAYTIRASVRHQLPAIALPPAVARTGSWVSEVEVLLGCRRMQVSQKQRGEFGVPVMSKVFRAKARIEQQDNDRRVASTKERFGQEPGVDPLSRLCAPIELQDVR